MWGVFENVVAFFSFGFTLKLICVVLFTLFMPITAITFFKFHLVKREKIYGNTIKSLGLTVLEEDGSPKTVAKEYAAMDFVIPLTFITFICLLGSSSLFLGGESFFCDNYNSQYSFLFSATYFPESCKKNDPNTLIYFQSLVTISIAFLGAFLWSSFNIIRRLVNMDVTPATYYYAGVRLIMSSMVALFFMYLMIAFGGDKMISGLVPVAAFITGMFPYSILDYLKDWIFGRFKIKKENAHKLPLEMIEGLSSYHIARLNEESIDNAENLAEADLTYLMRKTAFSAKLLVGWISQAKLYVYVKDDIVKLRQVYIRSIIDLRKVCNENGRISEVASQTGISEVALKNICMSINRDIEVGKLGEYQSDLKK